MNKDDLAAPGGQPIPAPSSGEPLPLSLWANTYALADVSDDWQAGYEAARAFVKVQLEHAPASEERFFMDHGVWHDRETGQHLYTEDQHQAEISAVWAALGKAGIERNGWMTLEEAIRKLAAGAPASQRPIQPQGAASPQGERLDVENAAGTFVSSEPNGKKAA